MTESHTAKTTREGDLVPANPTSALLCTYGLLNHDLVKPLTDSRPIPREAAVLARYLNGLPSSSPEGATCALMDTDGYKIIFSYASAPAVTVTIRPECGTVEQNDAIRYARSIRDLMLQWR